MNEVLTIRTSQRVSGLDLDRAVLHAQYSDWPLDTIEYDRFGLPVDVDGYTAIWITVRRLPALEVLERIIFGRAGL